MSFDLAVGPPFGSIGLFLHRRYGKLELGYAENIATGGAMVNLWANMEYHDPSFTQGYPAMHHLFEKEYLPPGKVQLFLEEWSKISALLDRVAISQFVRIADKEEAFKGTIVKSEADSVTIHPDPEELKEFIAETDEWAASEGHPGFHTASVKDAFWYQFEKVEAVALKAFSQSRALILT